MKTSAIAAVLLLFAVGSPAQAEQVGTGGGGTLGYSCDSKTDQCHCQGFFDCQEMKEKVCRKVEDGGYFACSVGKSDCNCEWNQKTVPGSAGRPSTTQPGQMAPRPAPTVRDHRSRPAVRDHREPAIRDHRGR